MCAASGRLEAFGSTIADARAARLTLLDACSCRHWFASCMYRRSFDRDGEEGFDDAEDALQRLVEREEAEQEVEEVRSV